MVSTRLFFPESRVRLGRKTVQAIVWPRHEKWGFAI
jgi:hypothetical protein